MSSPNPIYPGLVESEVILSARDRDNERVIAEAVAMECAKGEMVYEVISKTISAHGMVVRYRALPRRVWEEAVAKIPLASARPLIPQYEKNRRRVRMSWMSEGVILAGAGFVLIFGIVVQLLRIDTLRDYEKSLQTMIDARGVTSAETAIAHPQENWAANLNKIAQALAPMGGSILFFEFNPAGNLIRVSFKDAAKAALVDVEGILRQALGKEVVLVKEGLWSWRD